MIPDFSFDIKKYQKQIESFIENAIIEDIGTADHTSLACIPSNAIKKARLITKDTGIIAGIELARLILLQFDKKLKSEFFYNDGDKVNSGMIIGQIEGPARSILSIERLMLNCMQHMSAIATKTYQFVELLKNEKVKILDTRKTTPGNRFIEKWAVRIGGGTNYRFGLFDMILIKDNHVDYAGSIEKAIQNTKKYLAENKLELGIVVETRSREEVLSIIKTGGVDRIMLDNFSPAELKKMVELIAGRFETEASGNINESNLIEYAQSGVDFISTSSTIRQAGNFDLSLGSV